jgi:hypothetical protein
VKAHCPNCSTIHDVGTAVSGKIAVMLIGGAVGHAAARNPVVVVGTALLGLAIGEVIDREVIPRCPACGVALQEPAATL